MEPRRHNSLRLPNWDYTSSAYYFVTICTHQREHFFSNQLFRSIAEYALESMAYWPSAKSIHLDECIVMPDHVHLLIALYKQEDTPSLSTLVANYKSLTAKRINKIRHVQGQPVWQRGFYDRIMRNEEELQVRRAYVLDNPRRWAEKHEVLDKWLAEMNFHP
ncbi:MAG: transposase [Chloroflexi bacterium]|nr:transposase [Chloroflexota bacterium]